MQKSLLNVFNRFPIISVIFICFVVIISCSKEDDPETPEEEENVEEPGKEVPQLETNEVSNVSASSATVTGNITHKGSSSVINRGVSWSVNSRPTVEDNQVEASSVNAGGAFTAQITGLEGNTTYYVRAYATNADGTGYGEELSFTTERSMDENSRLLTIDASRTFQTIEHFGASDAWSGQFVGKWPSAKKEAIADLLFSQELDENGNPKGIALSLWRFNVGAGSAVQGSASGINDEWRRAESFLEADGSYNWERQEGQVWFAQAAQARSVDKLLLFSNSPPIHMTRNGKAHADNGEANLAPENFEEFGAYLATVAEGLENKGLDVDYISPVNEPQWDWGGGQEGTPFWNDDIAGIVRALNSELEERNLSVSIDVPEAAQINFLYEDSNKGGRANQIEAFYSENSPHYIGDLSHVGNAISGHSYFTASPFTNLINTRKTLASAVEEVPGLKFWMSEYCILGDNSGEIEGNGRDLGMEPALHVARVIYSDLAVAQATAWHWWLAVSPYDYKDGLVYIDYQKNDGNFYESKMLWGFGNYSRFIRPGFQRISIEDPQRSSMDEDFLFSAYKDPATGEVVVVVVNSRDEDVEIELELQGESWNNIRTYTTSSEKNLELQEIGEDEAVIVPAGSIMTITNQNL